MNHRRSVAAVSILAAVAFAACGEADDAGTTTTNDDEAEQSAAQEAKAHADALDAWAYYYDVTHPEPKAPASASVGNALRLGRCRGGEGCRRRRSCR